MDNIVEFTALNSGATNDMCCWLCQKSTTPRALFCHSCGTIQPVRPIDHFTRLGLELSVDIDTELLEKNYQTLKKTLDPDRFKVRGIGERGHAAKHLEALDTAYNILINPLNRGRYWLSLHAVPCGNDNIEAPDNAVYAGLRTELESATQTAQFDRVAQRTGQALEQGIKDLMQALRSKNWCLANALLAEVDGLETILNNVRTERAKLTPGGKAGDEITSVK